MKDERDTPASGPPAESSALDWARDAGIGDVVMRRTETRVRQRHRRRTVVALGVAALVVLALVVIRVPRSVSPSSVSRANLSTIVSRPAQRVLPDGSIVELKAGAKIVVDFSGQFRRVGLANGEAHFEVVKDPARPFLVLAGGIEVRAVGTAFSIDVAQQAVEVVVTEGRVSVVPAVAAQPTIETGPGLIYVDAGHRASVQVNAASSDVQPPAVSPISAAEMSDRLSWRVPRLEFVGTPLAEAIPMFNEHSARWRGAQIALGDPELERLQLSGIIRADNTETLLRVLASEFGIKPERRADGTIVLRKK